MWSINRKHGLGLDYNASLHREKNRKKTKLLAISINILNLQIKDMKVIKKHINMNFLLMFMLSMMNMVFLHQYFLQTISLEIPCFFSSFFDNLLACLIDVTFIFMVSWIITFRKVRASLVITFVITLLWSFCNVFYARFFHQYLSWSSIGLVGNLADPIVLDSMTAGFRLIDIYYPLVIILFCWKFCIWQ